MSKADQKILLIIAARQGFVSKQQNFFSSRSDKGQMSEKTGLPVSLGDGGEVGKLYPGQEAKVVDGELWFRGDNVFLGYYGDPEKTAETLTPDGWIKTGDLVRFDDEGYMYIVGRIKNLIILSNGENVSPESIEEPFYKCDKLRDCLVKEDELDGRKVIAIEILPRMEEFGNTSWEEVEKYFKGLVDEVNATLPTTHRISKLTVRKEDFKRTGAMKVSRN